MLIGDPVIKSTREKEFSDPCEQDHGLAKRDNGSSQQGFCGPQASAHHPVPRAGAPATWRLRGLSILNSCTNSVIPGEFQGSRQCNWTPSWESYSISKSAGLSSSSPTLGCVLGLDQLPRRALCDAILWHTYGSLSAALPYLLLIFGPLLHVGHDLIILSVQPTGVLGRRPRGQATDLWHKKKMGQ